MLKDRYFLFERLNNDRVVSLFTKKPLDLHAEDGERRRILSGIGSDLGYSFGKTVKCRQVHGDSILVVGEDAPDGMIGEADGLLTDVEGTALEIRTADCQAVFLYDPVRGVIGNIHSGWKGTAQKIAGKAVRMMRERYGCRPEDIEAYINPSILGCCFEIGEDVMKIFRSVTDADRYLTKETAAGREKKYYLDTAEMNRDLLIGEGLSPGHVFLSGICTKCRKEEYFSYRGERGTEGRNGAFICLKQR